MVRAVTTSGAGVDVVVGAAGHRQDRRPRSRRAAWASDGHHVIGAALAARAAAATPGRRPGSRASPSPALAASSSATASPRAPCSSSTKPAWSAPAPSPSFLAHARRADAKLVLVGDHRQLPEIDAGGAFASPRSTSAHTIHLTDNRRQRDRRSNATPSPTSAPAASTRPSHNSRTATAASPPPTAPTRCRDNWSPTGARPRQRRRVALMLAAGGAEVDDLNPAPAPHARSTPASSTRPRAHRRRLAVRRRRPGRPRPQPPQPRRHQRHQRPSPPSTPTVSDRRDRAGDHVTLPAGYIAAGHVNHGYATTIHKAQGATCDTSLVSADDRLYHEAGYTALTRGRHQNQLYVLNTRDRRRPRTSRPIRTPTNRPHRRPPPLRSTDTRHRPLARNRAVTIPSRVHPAGALKSGSSALCPRTRA